MLHEHLEGMGVVDHGWNDAFLLVASRKVAEVVSNQSKGVSESIIIFREPCTSQVNYVNIAFGDVVTNYFGVVAN